jgi:iron-sulfur cluster repair protein YtfE (RIC family)
MTTPSLDLLSMTVGEIVARHPQAAAILGAHHIDVCRYAHLALPTAVRIAAVHLDDVQRDLSRSLATPQAPPIAVRGRSSSDHSLMGVGTLVR